MSNEIKDLNPGGAAQLTDEFGVSRVSPDETFSLTGQAMVNLVEDNSTEIQKIEKLEQNQAHLIAIADIDNNAPQNSGKFYDLFDGTNGFSQGQLDATSDELTSPVVTTDTILPVEDGSQFTVKDEITISDGTNSERRVINNISSNDLTVPALTNGYAAGSKVYRSLYTIIGKELNFYTEGYDLSSPSYDSKTLDFTLQDILPIDIRFGDGDLKLFMLGSTSDSVYRYNLSNPRDISSGIFADKLDSSNEVTVATGFDIKEDGTKVWVVDDATDTMYEYNLITPFILSTGVYSGNSKLLTAIVASPGRIRVLNEGTKLYIIGTTGSIIYEATMSTAYAISTLTPTSSFDTNAQENALSGFDINEDGTKLWVIGITNDTVFQYSIGTAWTISSSVYDTVFYDVSTQVTNAVGFSFSNSGLNFHSINTTDNTLYQYSSFSSDFTDLDLRYNITPLDTASEIAAWITRDKFTGFSTDGAVSIVDSAADESFTDLSPTTIDLDANTSEDTYTHSVVTPEEKVTLRLTLTRALTTDDVVLLKILGAID